MNQYVLQLPWEIFFPLLLALIICDAIAILATATIAVYQFTRTPARFRGWSLVIISLVAPIYCVLQQSGHGPYTAKLRERSEALNSVRTIAQDARFYANDHEGKWPPHLAVMLVDGILRPKDLRYRLSRTPPIPPADVEHGKPWQSATASVQAHSDFAYLAADLQDSPALAAVASRLIVACGTRDLPEIPIAVHHVDQHRYEYQFTARPISFADGHAELIPLEKYPAVFDAHNTARATLGLPPQLRP
jgi:hypothetical protein